MLSCGDIEAIGFGIVDVVGVSLMEELGKQTEALVFSKS